jgi:hypothetical protein
MADDLDNLLGELSSHKVTVLALLMVSCPCLICKGRTCEGAKGNSPQANRI